ncbi:hypothetical protein BKA81DRAFT_344161 [Phyllosticta paracitricarpa]
MGRREGQMKRCLEHEELKDAENRGLAIPMPNLSSSVRFARRKLQPQGELGGKRSHLIAPPAEWSLAGSIGLALRD